MLLKSNWPACSVQRPAFPEKPFRSSGLTFGSGRGRLAPTLRPTPRRSRTDCFGACSKWGGAAALQSELDARVAKHFADANDQIYTLADKPKTGSELERAERLSTLAQEEVARANDRVRKLDAAGADLESASRVLSACCDCVGYLKHQRH